MNNKVLFGGLLLVIIAFLMVGCQGLPERPIKKISLELILDKELRENLNALNDEELNNIVVFLQENTVEDIMKVVDKLKRSQIFTTETSSNSIIDSSGINRLSLSISDSILDICETFHCELATIKLGEGCALGGCDGQLDFLGLYMNFDDILMNYNLQIENTLGQKVTGISVFNHDTGTSTNLVESKDNIRGLPGNSNVFENSDHTFSLQFRTEIAFQVGRQ